MPFWACSRFSASSQTTDCGPSITAPDTSSSRCAGQAVQEDGVRPRPRHQAFVHPVGREQIVAALFLAVVHRNPDVGNDRIRIAHGGNGIVMDAHPRAVRLRPGERFRRRAALRRAADGEIEIETRRGMDPARRDIVAVAAPGDALAGNGAALLLEGHHVRHQLAGVRAVRQPVDDRHFGIFGKLGQLVVIVGADHDRIDIARQHPRRVRPALAALDLAVLAGEHDDMPAQLAHRDLEGDARAGRGLLEDHGEHPAFERTRRVARLEGEGPV